MKSTKHVDINGNIKWVNEFDKLHREDGPAFIHTNGDKEWWVNDKRHREDGPAIEFVDGFKCWYLNGKLHREDGPAVEYTDGTKEWWINDRQISKESFNKRMLKKKLQELI